MMKSKIRTYSELDSLGSFEDRYRYLKLYGDVGYDTFGVDRYLNQKLYKSAEWKRIRDRVIFRDNGCDMGLFDNPINGRIIVHHMNPITVEDILNRSEIVFNEEYLVCVSEETHNAIHYGVNDIPTTQKTHVVRTKNDTTPWR